MKEEAQSIIWHSKLSEESKSLWLTIIAANDHSFAHHFIKSVGEDAQTLSFATTLLHARTETDVPLEAGEVSSKEQAVIETMQRNTETN